MLLRNLYGVEMGTSGLIIQAQSREEILADKMVALALRPNRIKNRDLWDIGWLKQQNSKLPLELIARKVKDHRRTVGDFLILLDDRMCKARDVPEIREAFIHEMRRFLPPNVIRETVEKKDFWIYLTGLIQIEYTHIKEFFSNTRDTNTFKM